MQKSFCSAQGLRLLPKKEKKNTPLFLGLQRAMIMCSAVQKQGMQLVKWSKGRGELAAFFFFLFSFAGCLLPAFFLLHEDSHVSFLSFSFLFFCFALVWFPFCFFSALSSFFFLFILCSNIYLYLKT